MRTNSTSGIAFRHRGFLQARSPLHPQMSVSCLRQLRSFPRASARPPPLTDADGSLTGFRRVNCPLRLRIDEALTSYREDEGDWCDAWRTHQPCSSSRSATLTSHRYNDCEPAPEFLDRSPRPSPGFALQSDQRSQRPTDKMQIFSWNRGPARGSGASLLASHLNGPVACDLPTRGVWFRHRQFPGGELPRGLPAPLRRAPQQGHFHARRFVHADPGPLLAQVPTVSRRGHGGYPQVPQVTRPVVLLFHRRQCSHQQRVCQAEVGLRRALAAHPRPVHEALRCHPHQRLQQGCRT